MLKISRSKLWFHFSNRREPDNFVLGKKYPNPLNPDKTIKFTIVRESSVTLKIYNILGEVLESFICTRLPQGIYSVKWNPDLIFPGTYFYRLTVNSIKNYQTHHRDVKIKSDNNHIPDSTSAAHPDSNEKNLVENYGVRFLKYYNLVDLPDITPSDQILDEKKMFFCE